MNTENTRPVIVISAKNPWWLTTVAHSMKQLFPNADVRTRVVHDAPRPFVATCPPALWATANAVTKTVYAEEV